MNSCFLNHGFSPVLVREECSLEYFVTRAPNRKLIENLQEIKLGSQQVEKSSDCCSNLIQLISMKILLKFLEPPHFFSERSYGRFPILATSNKGKIWGSSNNTMAKERLYGVVQKLSKVYKIYHYSYITQTLVPFLSLVPKQGCLKPDLCPVVKGNIQNEQNEEL